MKPLNMIKLSALAVSLAFTTAALSATEGNAPAADDWQSSLAAEFSKLDASGNGLLMPLEASRGKAFNKKTFAAADADKDGTIDQAEYINHRISLGATNQPGTASVSATTATEMPDTSSNTDTSSSLDNNTLDQTADATQSNAETEKRSVGAVIDDSVITTKAKAAIFNTPDLKTLQISVETRQGEVMLTGKVDSDVAKMKAEEVVKNVEGVSSVTNNLEVKGQP